MSLSQLLPSSVGVDSQIVNQVESLGRDLSEIGARFDSLAGAVRLHETSGGVQTRLEIFHGYVGVFIVAFLITIIMTPLMRRVAVSNGIIDAPTDPRKIHRMPIAYLGGLAVYLGLMGGILYSILATRSDWLISFHTSPKGFPVGDVTSAVPISIILGISLITLIGLLDDVVGVSPRLKIVGQLMAAAALAYQDVGVKVAAGLMLPLAETFHIPLTMMNGAETIGMVLTLPNTDFSIAVDFVYWTGTAIIAIFVLSACNASNLIDGLDGLLTGVTTICTAGLLFIALTLAMMDDGMRDGQRIILSMALLGACLGFLPHNFNPATIFLGDCGSMLMGFTTIVIVLMLGDTGKTHLVMAGLIIYGIPIVDTSLAIVRRKLAGQSISDADANHLHHMLKRALGVKGAVFSLYGIGIMFAVLGVATSLGRARVTYALTLIFASYIGVTAIKIARREHIDSQALNRARRDPSGSKASGSDDEAA